MKRLDKVLETLLGLMVAVMVLSCFWQVFTRFVLNSPSKYTEELLRYLLIWMTMIGVPYAFGKDRHLSINLVTRSFSPKAMVITKIGIEVLILFLSIFVMIAGGWMVTTNSSGQISPALHMPMELYYACVPIGGILMVLYGVDHLIRYSKLIEGGKIMQIQAAIVLLIVFFLLLAYGTPVSFSIISAALVTIIMFLTPNFGMFISAQKMVGGIDSFSLLAVPFFILAGLLMSSGGIARRLVNLALMVLGRVPGSLALTNVAGNAMFGSISGSGIAAATAIGGVMNPLEKEHGYDETFSAAVNIASAPVGQLIPPTTAPIIYSTAAGGISVAALLMAGWIPGLLWAGLCMLVAFLYGKKHGYTIKSEKLTMAAVGKTVWEAVPSLFLIVIIIGGILSGYFTPTEASGVAVVYAFILSVFIYKSIKPSQIMGILTETAVMTTIVMLIIGASSVLSFVLSFTGLPQAISALLLSVSSNKIVILLIINLILLIVGTCMDMAPALLIFTPIFLPVIKSLGMDPIQFGIMIIMNLAIGTITPPVGSVLFVGCSVAKLPVEDVMKTLVPYFLVIVAGLLLVTFIPAFSMWLPGVLGLL